MARVTRSSKLKAEPVSTPSKAAKAREDPDAPMASVENTTWKKDTSKGPYARKPRKHRQRDTIYKKQKRAQAMELKGAKLNALKFDDTERDTLRAGIHGNNTWQKLSKVVLEQRAEIALLRKQLNSDNKSSEDTTSPNDPARAGPGRRRQRKSIA